MTVYKLICAGSVEERMLELQARKQQIARTLQRDAEAKSMANSGLNIEDLELRSRRSKTE